MQKKVTFFVQNYEPHQEAISKEIQILHKNFNSEIFNINTSNPASLAKVARMPFVKSDIYHIYTSIADRLFLPLLRKRPIVLTGSAASKKEKIGKQIGLYKKVDRIVVESERQMKSLVELGIEKKKIRIIYPGIDLSAFSYSKPPGNKAFTILFASSPPSLGQMSSRGVDLMLECAEMMPEIRLVLLWRSSGYKELVKKIKSRELKNVFVKNRIVSDMSSEYSSADCTIAPFMNFDEDKPVPRSIIESMACGRPVLVSSRVNIAGLISKEKCGVVFEPSVAGVNRALGKIIKNYASYQKNCRKTAEKCFSAERFVLNYKKLYEELP